MDFTSISQLLKIGPPSAAFAVVAVAWLQYRYKLRAPGAYVDAINRAHGKGQRDAVVKLLCAANPSPKAKGHPDSPNRSRADLKGKADQEKSRERSPL